MLGKIIEKLASPWVEYNQKKLINEIFTMSPQIRKAIDVGSGEGGYSSLLLERFPNCDLLVGVDIQRERITSAEHKRTDSELSYVIANTYALPFKMSAFDLAFSKDMLHHLDRPVEGLKEISRVTRGEIVLVEANRPNPVMLLWTRYFNHQHLTWGQLMKIISRAGLQLESSGQIQVYPLDLLLLPIKHPMQYFWNLVVIVFLFTCNISPTLPRAFLRLFSVAAKNSFNILFVKSVVGNNPP